MASIPIMVIATSNRAFFGKKLFHVRAVSYIGKISYSVYLWQQLLAGEIFSSLSAVEHVALIGAGVAACVLLYEYFEKPLIQLGREMSTKFWKAPSLAAA